MEREPSKEIVGISVPSPEGEMILHWFNTRLRTFKDEQYNHIEYRDDEGQLKGIRPTQELMDVLFEHDFPYQYDPVVDDSTKEWLVQSEMRILQRELDEL